MWKVVQKNKNQELEKAQYNSKNNYMKFMTSKVYFWIACLTLSGVIFTTISTLITHFDIIKLITAVNPPFQGVWKYSSLYKKYYDESDPEQLRGVGKALIVWNSIEDRYDLFIGYQINRVGTRPDQQGVLAALSLNGSIETNIDGYPENDFKIGPMSIIGRLHYSNEGPAGGGLYQMTDCRYKLKNPGPLSKKPRPISIECDFKTSKSESRVEFTRENSLN